MRKNMFFYIVFSFTLFGIIQYSMAQSHFDCVSNTGAFYSIVVQSATIDSLPVEDGDEIAVLTPAGLCVGSAVVPPSTNIPLAAWKDDPQTPDVLDGYTAGELMHFVIWDASAGLELHTEVTFLQGDGTFEKSFSAQISFLSATTSVSTQQASIPNEFALLPNFPNPFNPETTIKYQIPKTAQVKLEIFNLLGQRVALLVDKEHAAQFYSIKWNGKDDAGLNLPSGIYLFRLQSQDFVQTRKLMLLR